MTTAAAKIPSTTAPSRHKRIDPRLDPKDWVRNNERITNEADLDGWLALYAHDAVFEAISDGAYDRAEGKDAIAQSAAILCEVFKTHRLHVAKRFVAAGPAVVVNAWTGGFGGRTRQFGTEIWTLREDLVVRHEMFTFCDVQPATSALGRMRSMLAGEARVKLAIATARQATKSWES